MKNYLLNALMAGGIVIGLSLSGAALGVALKNDKKMELSSITLADLDGGALSLLGGFKKKLISGSVLEKVFFEHFGFVKNGGTKVNLKQIKTTLVATKILDLSKITAEFIGKFRNSPNGLKVTKKTLGLCEITFKMLFEINLDQSEKVKFNKSLTHVSKLRFYITSSGYELFIIKESAFEQGDYFTKTVSANKHVLLNPIITSKNKDDFEVYYAKNGGYAKSNGSDFQYALAVNGKTNVLYFFTKTKTEKITFKIKFFLIDSEKKLWKT